MTTYAQASSVESVEDYEIRQTDFSFREFIQTMAKNAA